MEMDRQKRTRTQKSLLSVTVQPQSLGCCYPAVISAAVTAWAGLEEGDDMLMEIVNGSTGENMKLVR